MQICKNSCFYGYDFSIAKQWKIHNWYFIVATIWLTIVHLLLWSMFGTTQHTSLPKRVVRWPWEFRGRITSNPRPISTSKNNWHGIKSFFSSNKNLASSRIWTPNISKIFFPFWENTFNEPLKDLPMLLNGTNALVFPLMT